jgi:hypothetical protein
MQTYRQRDARYSAYSEKGNASPTWRGPNGIRIRDLLKAVISDPTTSELQKSDAEGCLEFISRRIKELNVSLKPENRDVATQMAEFDGWTRWEFNSEVTTPNVTNPDKEIQKDTEDDAGLAEFE